MSDWKRLMGLQGSTLRAVNTLGGFVDSLLQGFENRRGGLADHGPEGGGAALDFFAQLYEAERPRLREAVQLPAASLPAAAQDGLARQVDELIRGVVVPAYVRLTVP